MIRRARCLHQCTRPVLYKLNPPPRSHSRHRHSIYKKAAAIPCIPLSSRTRPSSLRENQPASFCANALLQSFTRQLPCHHSSKMRTYVLAALAILAPFALASQAAAQPQGDILARSDTLGDGTPLNAPGLLGPLTLLFETAESVPDEVLEAGDDAADSWLVTYGFRNSGVVIEARSAPSPSLLARAQAGIIDVIKCAAAIISTAIPAAKLLKIKKYVKALGGARKAAEKLLKAKNRSEALRIGGEALRDLFDVISGLDDIRENC
ncbi:hypothetical protein B0T18DRAFT_412781 [Schizothecium vesticola]|uniref:Uncharacterized protein n=1 Tax=Schizothecium vesticola TaxID=314040 RepID=A0AA40EX10_9PEZI|nr:hypothetical protein B0T18DRAFT_412781 [Schizothecium vesticola]